MKLQVGDVIEVQGFVMLAKLDGGKYVVSRIRHHLGQPGYVFRRPRGKRDIVAHYCSSVDGWISDKSCEDHNKIVKLT